MKGILLNIEKYLKNDLGEPNFLSKIFRIIIIIIITRFLILMIYRFVDSALRHSKKGQRSMDSRRADTLGDILKNLFKYIFTFIAAMTILDLFNVNTTSILATAGVGGLAIGFGAQSLVKDVITGFFILLEDQYLVGDYISIASYEGIVEELGIRTTKLRDFSGDLHIIPNGEIKIVSNRNRGPMRSLVVISIGYDESIDQALEVLKRTCEGIKRDNKAITEGPNVLGVTNLANSSIDITIVAKTVPMEQWNVEREIRKKCKEALTKANIEIPYNKLVVYNGGEDNA